MHGRVFGPAVTYCDGSDSELVGSGKCGVWAWGWAWVWVCRAGNEAREPGGEPSLSGGVVSWKTVLLLPEELPGDDRLSLG